MTSPETPDDRAPSAPIAKLKKRLEKHPHIRFEASEHQIEIFPESETGFGITLLDEGFQCTVTFDGGWYDHFTDPEEAIECVGFGLSEMCRLRIDMRGDFPQRWIVEYLEDNAWLEDSTTGLVFFPFWRKMTTLYRQNTLLSRERRIDL